MSSLIVGLLHTLAAFAGITFVLMFYAYVVDEIRLKKSIKDMQIGYDEAVRDIVLRGCYWNRNRSEWTYVQVDILKENERNENY